MKSFNKYGSNWLTKQIIPEENELFRWIKVVAVWSGCGRMPLWHNEPRTFFFKRQRKIDG